MSNEQLAMSKGKKGRMNHGGTRSFSSVSCFFLRVLRVLRGKNSCFFLFSFLFALFSFSCKDPFVAPTSVIPDGQGSFSLTVTVADAVRTILPSDPLPDIFPQYTLSFTATSGGQTKSEPRSSATLSDPVYLVPGTYTLLVTAYLDEGMIKAAARGSLPGIVINPGAVVYESIELNAIISSGNGDFTYNVTFANDVETATMKVTPLNPATGTSEATHTLSSGADGKLELKTGYYNVLFTLVKENGDTLIWRELLHIYSSLESSFSENFVGDEFYKTKYNVTFNFNGGEGTFDGEQSVLHGASVAKPTPNPTKDNFYFYQWCSDIELETEFIFTTLIMSDTTVYAKWGSLDEPLTELDDIEAFFEGQTGGTSVDDPVTLYLDLDLGIMANPDSNWQLILTALNLSGKYVNLDLSRCTIANNTSTEFKPASSSPGTIRIVSIALPNVAESIPLGFGTPFYNFTNLKSFSGIGLKTIDSQGFIRCTSLTMTELPAGITTIGNSAFEGCTGLALTSLPASLTSIGDSVFRDCTSLALTELPAGIASIGNSAFANCTSLALTELPAGLASIGVSAFAHCVNLALTELPAGLSSIGSSTFTGCSNLALTELPASLTSIGDSVFRDCMSLALTELPTGIISIGERAFETCMSLTLTELPPGLTSIGERAFNYCENLALTSLPVGLSSIGNSAFSGCTSLATITFRRDEPPTAGTTIFGSGYNLSSSLEIWVPAASVDTYKGTAGWSTYEEIIFGIPDVDDEDFGEGATIDRTFDVSNIDEWNDAMTFIKGGGDDRNYIINIIEDFAVPSLIDYTFGTYSYIKVSLRGTDRTLILDKDSPLLYYPMIYIRANQTVILRDLTLKGLKGTSGYQATMVDNRGTFTMRGGKITDTESSGGSDDVTGAVNNRGTFTMWDGEISGNIGGGGVYVRNGGTFTMYDGEISGNIGVYGGGVQNDGTVTMYGGKISDNTGRGVYNSGTFTMIDGEISGNSSSAAAGGGGVYMNTGTFTMWDGEISDNTTTYTGGGVAVSGTNTIFNMHGGKISSNTATRGGGVYVLYGAFRLVTGTIYGSNEIDASLRNIGTTEWAALYKENGTAERGFYISTNWSRLGDLTTTNNTIKVEDGVEVQ